MQTAFRNLLLSAATLGVAILGPVGQAGAQITVQIFAPGSYTASGHGAPFTGAPVCTLTASVVQFGGAGGWHPCTVVGNDFGAQVTGAFTTAGGQFSFASDDGSAIFLDGSSSAFASNDGAHGNTSVFFTPSAGTHTFLIDYFECCGNPGANLNLNLPERATFTSTPEPSSMALLGTGLVGLVPMMRRRRK